MLDIKKNHHYVPQFWLKAFADSRGSIHAWDGKSVKVRSSRVLMQEDWLYTIFDNAWNPSDNLEDALAKVEATAASLFLRVSNPTYKFSADDRSQFCEFLALQACRHPDIMNRGARRARELGAFLANVHACKDEADFVSRGLKFGLSAQQLTAIYHELMAVPQSQLNAELDELHGLSPQDARLPQQDALRAIHEVEQKISGMCLTVLDAPQGEAFILGDTPLPQADLLHGFGLPLGQRTAIQATPSSGPQTGIGRRIALPAEVALINQTQWENSLHFVIGPDPAQLLAFAI